MEATGPVPAPHEPTLRAEVDRIVGGLESAGETHPFFRHWAGQTVASWAEVAGRAAEGSLQLTGDEVLDQACWLMAHPGRQVFYTSRVSTDGFWARPESKPLHDIAVDVARRGGVVITRILVFTDAAQLYSGVARAILAGAAEQAAAGVQLAYALLPEVAGALDEFDLAIWDDAMVSYTAYPTPAEPTPRATYQAEPSELDRARRIERAVRAAGRPLDFLLADYELGASAVETVAIAALNCSRRTGAEESCLPYHSAWQFLNMLALVETAKGNGEFFVDYLRQLARDRTSLDVLVCGLADFEMLKVVLLALEASAARTVVHVIDACPTPIHVVGRFLENHDSPVRVDVAVRRAEDTGFADASFDVVVSDAFLSKIPFGNQAAVVAEWRRILRPGGEVLTTIRVTQDDEPIALRASAEQVSRFAEKAAAKTALRAEPASGPAPFPLGSDEAAKMAQQYAFHNVTYPLSFYELGLSFPGFVVEVVEQISFEEYSVGTFAKIVATRAS